MFIPKNRSTVLLALSWLIFLTIAFSDAGVNFLIAIPIYLLFILWIFSWIIRSIGAIILTIVASDRPARKKLDRQKIFNGSFESILLLLSLALVHFQIPMMIRLKLSEPALDRYIRDIYVTNKAKQKVNKIASPTRWIGLFNIEETELLDGGIVRIITANDFFDDAGFVYSPDRQPPTIGEDSYRHLYGPWWYWSRSW